MLLKFLRSSELTYNVITFAPLANTKFLRQRNVAQLFQQCRQYSVNPAEINDNSVEIHGHCYTIDNWTNVTPKILSYLGANKHLQQHHPLSIMRQRIVNYFYETYKNSRGSPIFSVYDNLSPLVTVQQNFDNLLIPLDHVSRSKSDCYYINQTRLLRAHTTAHQADLIASGLDNFLIVGEVYRRDQIDKTHYPVFHQLDAVRLVNKEKLFERTPELEIFESDWNPQQSMTQEQPKNLPPTKFLEATKQPCHTLEAVKLMEHEMKSTLVKLAAQLFGRSLKHRWVEAYFPFTQPSWELEIYFNDSWLEVLGCGIIRHEILQKSGVQHSIGYAFGIGLERLAMALFQIPDIRLFWSTDTGFLSQFKEDNLKKAMIYKPISSYPQCTNDLSFWLPEKVSVNAGFAPNDFYDMVRTVAGDMVEQISFIDSFRHPKVNRWSVCFRIVYRHMERTLTQAEVNDIHKIISNACVKTFKVEIR